jgi:hypothetical protein
MMYWLDHVVVAVADLEGAATAFMNRYGLASYEGGRHAGLGTANRIIPLGREYIELLAVVDRDSAADSRIGSWIARAATAPGRLASWCLGTDDLNGIARRTGLAPQAMTRTRPDGVTLSWRSAGFDRAMDSPGLPFFISWDVPAVNHPGSTPAPHRVEVKGLATIVLGGDTARLREWLGEHDLPVRFSGGPAGVESISIATDSGTIEIP